jgi:hypothetical protein
MSEKVKWLAKKINTVAPKNFLLISFNINHDVDLPASGDSVLSVSLPLA